MANTSADEVAELKQELAQFLLTEITSAQGAQTFRKEVSAEVTAVIDQVLNERLQKIEQQAAEQANALTARVEAALRKVEPGQAAAVSPEAEQKIAELTARLDEMRSRLVRMEEQGRRAVAQPIAAPKLADERIAVTPKNTSLVPRWALWVIILLLLLTALGLGNIYLERMTAPEPAPANANTPAFVPPSAGTAPSNPAPAPSAAPATTPSNAPASTPPTHATAPAAVPPQNPPSNPAVTPTPINTVPPASPAVPPTQHARAIPAEFAIERGWLAAQPFAVEGSAARHAGASGHITTLKSLVCGRSVTCTADSLFSGPQATQFIALQMVMSQIGDRFCNPRRPVHVTGEVNDRDLLELANVMRCPGLNAGGPCKEGDNKVCLPDSDMIEAGDVNALSQALRWALWKTGVT